MLTTLRIKNLALVADLTIELQPGYNVITGETGAGKSILIGALNLALGERADRTLIRSGSDSCSVEAAFDVARLRAPLQSFLEDNGLEPCEDHQLVLKRAFTNAGTNRQFINGSPTTLNILAALGEWLVDIHGPHEHQSLLHPARQLAILDAFGNLDGEREAFADLVRRRAALEAEKGALIVDEKTYAQQLDLLRFQADEIAAARLQPEEEAQVEQDYRRASNAAKLLQLSQAALGLLSENETSLLTQAGIIGRTLQELQRVDASAANLQALHEQAVSALHDLQAELSHYSDKTDLDPARLQQLEERLNLIHSLKRKYGATLAEVIAFGDEARRQTPKPGAAGCRTGPAQRRTPEARGRTLARRPGPFRQTAQSHPPAQQGRQQTARRPRLQTKPPRHRLDDPGSIRLHATAQHAPHSHGLDTIEFQFAPNPGEPARPLRAIASSGELARVMLALKTVLAAEDQIPVLVFDEVDANVGGETANAVGEKMQQIAQKRQVLCITHLPQVAAPASAHYVATKQTKAGRTDLRDHPARARKSASPNWPACWAAKPTPPADTPRRC